MVGNQDHWQIYIQNPNVIASGTFREYFELLNKSLKHLHDILLNLKSKRLAMINQDRASIQKWRFSLYHFPSY